MESMLANYRHVEEPRERAAHFERVVLEDEVRGHSLLTDSQMAQIDSDINIQRSDSKKKYNIKENDELDDEIDAIDKLMAECGVNLEE